MSMRIHVGPRALFAAAILSATFIPPAWGQTHLTQRTLALDEGATPAPATIGDVEWLVGWWEGEALGGRVEEVWTTPVGTAMMGMFRLAYGDSVRFLEIMTLSEDEGSLVLRIKHFDPDLTAWEDREEMQKVPLVSRSSDTLHFHGLTLAPQGPDSLHLHLAFRERSGDFREELFRYRRVR